MIIGVNTLLPTDIGGINGVYAGHDERYFRCLLNALRALQTENEFVLFCDDTNQDQYEGWIRVNLSKSTGLFAGLRSGTSIESAAAKAKVDVLLTPLAGASTGGSLPQVLYANDLLPWEPEGEARRTLNVKAEKRACAAAKSVVVTSEYLRRKCLDLFEVPLNKVLVAPPGVDPIFQTEQSTVVEAPYMCIFCDDRAARGADRLFEALGLLEKEFDHTFVIVGPGFQGEPDDWGPRFVRIERLPDATLAGLYQHADVFIYAGMHDGCCVRVLEALAAGVPVVAQRNGAMHEHAADAPIYYNNSTAVNLVQCVRRAVGSDSATRAARIQAGRSLMPRFSWEKAAWKLLTALSK